MGEWWEGYYSRGQFDRWDRERRERRGTWRDPVAWLESLAPPHDGDPLPAGEGPEGEPGVDAEREP